MWITSSMAIPIAILDCDLLLHGRGHKTLDRFDLDSVSDTFLLTQFGFPREFILYLVELLREVSMSLSSVFNTHIQLKTFPIPSSKSVYNYVEFNVVMLFIISVC